jgi:hypothetical protein
MGLNYNPSIVSDGLVFYLDAANRRCYSGSGSSSNSLVSGIGVTLINGVGFTSTNNGYFSLDGTNDYLGVSNNSSLQPTRLTLEVWFKLNVPLSSQPTDFPLVLDKFTLSSLSGYRIIFWKGGNELQFSFFNSSTDNNVAISGANAKVSTNWNCVQGTYDGFTSKIYLNGVLENSLSTTASISYNNEDIYLGTFYEPTYGFLHYINANFGNVRIYNRALTPQEIAQNFNATRYRYGI